MKLLKEISSTQVAYTNRLEKISEKVTQWLEKISEEKRLGLPTMDVIVEAGGDPYNSANRQAPPKNNSVNFSPQPNVERPVINQQVGAQKRIHLVYDPSSGKIEKALKTPMTSRPSSEYIEANAQQVHDALTHLERTSPKLADLLVNGSLSIWIPRSAAQQNSSPQQSGTCGTNIMKMSPDRLAQAQAAAGKMSLA